MATQAQLDANRANARSSTGPKTAQGKARSAVNNFRHGFRSQSVLVPGDDPAEYQALLDELREHFEPEDLTEDRCVREMADADWRLRHVRRYQESLLAGKIEELRKNRSGDDPILLQALAVDALHRECSSFLQLFRYENKFERQYDKAYHYWETYQESRSRNQRRPTGKDLEQFITSYLSAPIPRASVLPDEPNSTPR